MLKPSSRIVSTNGKMNPALITPVIVAIVNSISARDEKRRRSRAGAASSAGAFLRAESHTTIATSPPIQSAVDH